jgi:phosphoglycolate phosphatase
MKHTTKAIVFDYDGVIVDTLDITVAIHQEFRDATMTVDRFRDLMDGNIYQTLKEIISEEDMEAQIDLFFREYHQRVAGIEVIPGMDALIHVVGERKIPQHIVSSSSERTIVEQLKRHHLAPFFYDILGTETDRSKVTKFKQILTEYTFAPEDLLFVTDTTGDVREAHELNIPTVAVTWGYHEEARLRATNPDYIANTPGELLHIITEHTGTGA